MLGTSLTKIFDNKEPGYSPEKAAKIACKITFNPDPDARLNETQRETLKQAQQETIIVDKNPVQIYDWNPHGIKKVLLVHGVGGKCLDFVELINVLVAQNYRVIGFDAPSHGLSNKSPTGVDIGNFWRCIQHLVEKFGYHFDLAISHSFGSAALTFQMRRNAIQVDNLVMFAPNAVFDSIIKSFIKQINADPALFPLICDLTAERFSDRIEREELWLANSPLENMRVLDSQGMVQRCIILHGTKDIMFPVEESASIVDVCKAIDKEHHVFESGHKSILSENQAIQIVKAFSEKILHHPIIGGEILPSYRASHNVRLDKNPVQNNGELKNTCRL